MGSISRRLFLQESLLATTAACAASTGALAAVEEAAGKKDSPNGRLSVAVIGAGIRGGAHSKIFAARSDCDLTYVCDADAERGESVAARFAKKPEVVQDMRRIFDDKSVDIVSIATPNHWHSLAAIWAMQAGKDVYVEKPVSHNVVEGRRMVQAARKYDRICQAGTQHRAAGCSRAAAEYVRQGKLGEIKLAHLRTYRLRRGIGPAGAYTPPPTVDYDLWAGPAPMELPVRRPKFHYDWHWFWDWGNGELGNNSIHAVDLLRMIVDLKGLGRGVMSFGGRVGFGDDCGETPSTQITVHDFSPMTLVQEVRELKTEKPKPGVVLIVGSEGYLNSAFTHAEVFDPDGNLIQRFEAPGVNHFGNFIEAVKTRKREGQTAEINEGHVSTALVHVANISQRLGQKASPQEIQQSLESLNTHEDVIESFTAIRQHLADNDVDIEKTQLTLGPWIGIDSDSETFLGNPAANALLSEKSRKPFEVPAENEL